jgi:DNA-binding SARP family transcriptional activator
MTWSPTGSRSHRPVGSRHVGKRVTRNIVDALGSLLTAVLVFGATPAVLVTVVGNPLGDGLGHQWREGARLALAGVALVAWLAWLACCTQLTRSVVAQVRRGHVSTPAGAVLTERVAARIAAGVLSLIALASPLALTSGAGASSRSGSTAPAGPLSSSLVNVASTATQTTAPTASAVVPAPAPAPAAAAATYVVQPGDSLWSIADVQLGASDDWPAIAALNLGRPMPGGLRFVDPNRIYTGWTLQMPDQPLEAAAPAESPLAAPAATPATVAVPPAAAASAPAPARAAHVIDEPPASAPLPIGTQRLAVPVASSISPRPSAVAPDGAGPGHLSLPELSALGVGALTCAALARRSRRMRVLRQMTEAEPEPGSEHSDEVIDTDVLLGRFAGLPALGAFEVANYGLAQALARSPRDPSVGATNFRAICVGAHGVDFWLAEPGVPAPAGFTLAADAQVWRAAHHAFTSPDKGWPALPIVLPVGEDESGTWLIPLTPGSCLPLVGEAGGDLWRAARAAQESWSWADMVLITEDPGIVTRELRMYDHGQGPPHGQQILFFGDPELLSPTQGREVSIVTRSLTPGSELTVLVDRHAASIHPLGRTVRPHLMTPQTAEVVGHLVAYPALDDGRDNALGDDPFNPARSSEGEPVPGTDAPAVEADLTMLCVPSPGTVEVKLLTATPRLEGLTDPLPANRSRRAVELVAYLALHHGDEVTSDRLRTRVLGSADADAASKTLFNIATAARRAMGFDADGTTLFPSGSRTGHYRVSAGVSVDVHRAADLATQGSATPDPDVAMALLREALSLVEGEPMANALSGYAWWEAEGHGARIAAVLVNAAGDLAALAVNGGNFELAQWGLEQARLVDPYSEAISRVAMQVAAAAGDADRLRWEWRECHRRIDELDPGSTPSRRTERLYGELAQRVLVGVTGSGPGLPPAGVPSSAAPHHDA